MGRDLNLPTYEDDKTLLVKGSALNRIVAAIKANRPLPGSGTTIREKPDGRQIDVSWPPLPPATGDYVLTSSNGVVSWTAITDCP